MSESQQEQKHDRKEAVLSVRVVLDFSYARQQLKEFWHEGQAHPLRVAFCETTESDPDLIKSIFKHLASIEQSLTGASIMTPEVQALIDQATATKGTEASALVVINGILGRINTAVAAAVASGAISAADAALITQTTADLKSGDDALAAGIATDAATQAPPVAAPVAPPVVADPNAPPVATTTTTP